MHNIFLTHYLTTDVAHIGKWNVENVGLRAGGNVNRILKSLPPENRVLGLRDILEKKSSIVGKQEQYCDSVTIWMNKLKTGGSIRET